MHRFDISLTVAGLLAITAFSHASAQFMQQGGKLVGTGAGNPDPSQGWSVALSSDGNTAIVGGYADNSSAGASWVFARAALAVQLSMFKAECTSTG